MAGAYEQLGVGAHERLGHRDRRAVGEHERRVLAVGLDHREDVVPAAGVQAVGVLAQLIEDLLQLKGRRICLDQHRRPDRPPREREPVLGELKDVVPQSRLEVMLELGQVQVHALAAGVQPWS
jgi:hypothetical protein